MARQPTLKQVTLINDDMASTVRKEDAAAWHRSNVGPDGVPHTEKFKSALREVRYREVRYRQGRVRWRLTADGHRVYEYESWSAWLIPHESLRDDGVTTLHWRKEAKDFKAMKQKEVPRVSAPSSSSGNAAAGGGAGRSGAGEQLL